MTIGKMNKEDMLRVKDNTSENGDDEYYQSENKNDYSPKFEPMSCFEN